MTLSKDEIREIKEILTTSLKGYFRIGGDLATKVSQDIAKAGYRKLPRLSDEGELVEIIAKWFQKNIYLEYDDVGIVDVPYEESSNQKYCERDAKDLLTKILPILATQKAAEIQEAVEKERERKLDDILPSSMLLSAAICYEIGLACGMKGLYESYPSHFNKVMEKVGGRVRDWLVNPPNGEYSSLGTGKEG